MECDENAKPSEGLLEKEYRRYVIFLSSKDPAIRYPPRRTFFYLSDTTLGLQPYSNNLVGSIRMLAKREREH